MKRTNLMLMSLIIGSLSVAQSAFAGLNGIPDLNLAVAQGEPTGVSSVSLSAPDQYGRITVSADVSFAFGGCDVDTFVVTQSRNTFTLVLARIGEKQSKCAGVTSFGKQNVVVGYADKQDPQPVTVNGVAPGSSGEPIVSGM
jgi:hypothetical protein